MTLPDLNTRDNAEDVIGEVLADQRIAQLRRTFAPSGDLALIVAHAESLLPTMKAPSERTQLRRIVARWKRILNTGLSGPAVRDALSSLVADAGTWDVRVGAERDFVPTSVELFPMATADLIMSLARDWNMTIPASPQGSFDAIIPIGGLIRANLSRPAYAAHLLASGTVTADMVIALASERETSEAEHEQASGLGAPTDSEQAALEFGMERAFGFDSRDWSPTSMRGLKQAPSRYGLSLFVGAAPASSLTGRRATTGEAFSWLLAASVLPSRASILQITATSCWLASHVALLTRLPEGTHLVTVGEQARNDGATHATAGGVRSQRYLQELKAFIDSLPCLRSWAQSAGDRASVHQDC